MDKSLVEITLKVEDDGLTLGSGFNPDFFREEDMEKVYNLCNEISELVTFEKLSLDVEEPKPVGRVTFEEAMKEYREAKKNV
jgi:hypothetical protein